MSTHNHIKFVSYKPEAFAGISSQNAQNMIIFFPDDKPITVFEGDQGLCKTSNLECLERLMGGKEIKNAVNTYDGDKKGELEIQDTKKGCRYIIRFTKTSFSITRIENEEGKERKYKVEEPIAFLADLIGNVSTSPMALKEKKGAEQIKWIREVVKPSQEMLDMEKKLNKQKQEAYDARTEVNRDIKRIGIELGNSNYYKWDDDNRVFIETPDFIQAKKVVDSAIFDEDDLREKLSLAQANNNQLNRARVAVDEMAAGILRYTKQYDEMEEQIEKIKAGMYVISKEKEELEKRKNDGETWVEENKDAERILDGINETWLNFNKLQAVKTHVQNTKNQHVSYLQKEQEAISLTAKVDEYTNLQKETVRQTIPDIPGLEIFIDGIDPQKEEGLYYNGRSMQELSESELWDLDLQLSKATNTKVKMIENITSLGSAAIERINWFVENGGRVFCTKMDRLQKDLKISFYDKLD